MASIARPKFVSHARPAGHPDSAQRITVDGLFLHNMRLFSGLPGETSQFNQADFGYEWRCECDIGASQQLHFSLMDLQGQLRPVAVLYLVDLEQQGRGSDRRPLQLEDLERTHEQLNELLAGRSATIETFTRASGFIGALARVREVLGDQVVWA